MEIQKPLQEPILPIALWPSLFGFMSVWELEQTVTRDGTGSFKEKRKRSESWKKWGFPTLSTTTKKANRKDIKIIKPYNKMTVMSLPCINKGSLTHAHIQFNWHIWTLLVFGSTNPQAYSNTHLYYHIHALKHPSVLTLYRNRKLKYTQCKF